MLYIVDVKPSSVTPSIHFYKFEIPLFKILTPPLLLVYINNIVHLVKQGHKHMYVTYRLSHKLEIISHIQVK